MLESTNISRRSRALKRKHSSLLIVRRQDTCQGTCNVYLQTNKGQYRSTLLCIVYMYVYVCVCLYVCCVQYYQ